MAEASGHNNKQELTKINNDLNLIKYDVMNTLTDNMPYIENCVMTTYVRNGKRIVELIDGRTVNIMRREEERNKGSIFSKIICRGNPPVQDYSLLVFSIRVLPHTSY